MTDAIIFTAFDLIPMICIFAGMGWLRCLLDDGLWLDDEPVLPAPQPEEIALDSYDLLVQEMETLGVEVTGLASIPMTSEGYVLVDSEELHPVDVDMSDAEVEPTALPVYPIFVVGDHEVERALVRDGLAEQTVVEVMGEEDTLILVEDTDEEFIDDLVSSLALPYTHEVLVGSDEAVFFEETAYDDVFVEDEEMYYGPTLVDSPFELPSM